MSYILDAIRRADSERERGSVPKLHANPAPADLIDDERVGPRWPAWVWAVLAMGLLLLGALASQWLSRDSGETSLPSAASPQIAAPLPHATTPPLAAPPKVEPGPELVRLQAPQALPLEAPAPVAAPSQSSSAAAAATRAEANADRVPGMNELPAEIRRQLPALVTGGAMYSETPANRMLIINGQIFHEGDKVSPNLVLERIKLNAAVLSFNGHRYAISY